MRATRTILMWSVAAVFGAIGGFPAAATAQVASAELGPYPTTLSDPRSECYYAIPQPHILRTMRVSPNIKEMRPLGAAVVQQVRVRWSLYYIEGAVDTGLQWLKTSSWYQGIAQAATQPPKPMFWSEVIRHPITGVETYSGLNSPDPNWGVVVTPRNIETRLYAWVEYKWMPTSAGFAPFLASAWAAYPGESRMGLCYAPYPF